MRLFAWNPGASASWLVAWGFFFLGIVQAQEVSLERPLVAKSLLLDVIRAGDRLVAVGERGHVLLSEDHGKTWIQRVTPTRAMLTAGCSVGGNEMWLVGHDAVILYSEDGGWTWGEQYRNADLEMPLLDVWFANKMRGIAVGAYGLCLVTEDGGATWQRQEVDEEEPHLFGLSAGPDGRLYMAGEFGAIFLSTDEGRHWKRLPSPYEGTFFGVLALQDGTVLVFGLRGNVFRSNDQGETWTSMETGTEAGLFVAHQAEGGTVRLGGQSGVLLTSHDGGVSFTIGNRGGRNAIGSLLPVGVDDLVLVGEGGVQLVAASDTKREESDGE